MRHVIGRIVFGAALVGLGVLIHALTPPAPRWEVRTGERLPLRVFGLVDDDRRVVTMQGDAPDYGGTGPFVVRDAATGAEIFRAWGEADAFKVCRIHPSGRWAVAVGDERMRWVDLATGEAAERPVARADLRNLHVPPGAPFAVLIDQRNGDPVDRAPATVLDLRPGGAATPLLIPWRGMPAFPSGRMCFTAPGRNEVVVWDLDGRREVARLPGTLHHDGAAGPLVVLGDGQDALVVWDVSDDPRVVLRVPTGYPALAQLGGGRLVVAPLNETGAHPLQVWDVRAGRKEWELPIRHSGVVGGYPSVSEAVP